MGATNRAFQNVTKVIAISGTTSESVSIGDYGSGSVQLPAALTGTTLTIQTSNDGTTWATCRDIAGAAKAAITFAASITVPLHAEAFASKFLRLLSNGTEAAARSFIFHLKG